MAPTEFSKQYDSSPFSLPIVTRLMHAAFTNELPLQRDKQHHSSNGFVTERKTVCECNPLILVDILLCTMVVLPMMRFLFAESREESFVNTVG